MVKLLTSSREGDVEIVRTTGKGGPGSEFAIPHLDKFGRLPEAMLEGNAVIYGPNANGDRAAYIVPGLATIEGFAADPDSANLNGWKTAAGIYQIRLSSDPITLPDSTVVNSRVGFWWNTVWAERTTTPGVKASHYSHYFITRSAMGADGTAYPQEFSAAVFKATLASSQTEGKVETVIQVCEIEAGGNAKGVIKQGVMDNNGVDAGWDISDDADDNDDADDIDAGSLDPDASTTPTSSVFPTWGDKNNNGGATSSTGAYCVAARKISLGGSPWYTGLYIKKLAVAAFAIRYKRNFAVQANGFDPGDGGGAHAMAYMGLGTDLPLTPFHIQGPIPIERRTENVGTVSTGVGFKVGADSFYGRSDFGTTTVEYAGIRYDAIDPTHSAEVGQATVRTRWNGTTADRFHYGKGLWSDGTAGGDPGFKAINVDAVYVGGVLLAGVDTMAPATPSGLSDPPTQTLRTSAAGTQQIIVTWTWTANTETDLAGYIVAYRRATSGSFTSVHTNDTSFALQANAGEVLQLKVLAYDTNLPVANRSLYTSALPAAGYTVAGDINAPGIVSVVLAPVTRPKAVVMKVTAPSSANCGGLALYCSVNSATATLIDFKTCKPGKLVKFRDDDAHTVGDTLAYSIASVNQDLVESATKTSIGSVTYALIKPGDLDTAKPNTAGQPILTMASRLGADGTYHARIKATWSANVDPIIGYSVEITDGTITTTKRCPSNFTYFDVVDGLTYQVQVTAINQLNVPGLPGLPTSLLAAADTTSPASITGGSVSAIKKGVKLSWTDPADLDFARVAISRNTVNTSGTATVVNPNGKHGKWIDHEPLDSTQTYWYWGQTYDETGNTNGTLTAIGNTAPAALATTDLPDAKRCARLNPADLTDWTVLILSSAASPSWGVGVSTPNLFATLATGATLTLNVNMTGTGGYLLPTDGDTFNVANDPASNADIIFIGGATYHVPPAEIHTFTYSSATSRFERILRQPVLASTGVLSLTQMRVGTGTQAWSNNLDLLAAMTSPAALLAKALQPGRTAYTDDAAHAPSWGTDGPYIRVSGAFTGNHNLNLTQGTAVPGCAFYVDFESTGGFSLVVKDAASGTTLLTMTSGTGNVFRWNGTGFELSRV